MEAFLLGIVVAFGPSVAAVAWLIWYSGAFEGSDGDFVVGGRGQSDSNRADPTALRRAGALPHLRVISSQR